MNATSCEERSYCPARDDTRVRIVGTGGLCSRKHHHQPTNQTTPSSVQRYVPHRAPTYVLNLLDGAANRMRHASSSPVTAFRSALQPARFPAERRQTRRTTFSRSMLGPAIRMGARESISIDGLRISGCYAAMGSKIGVAPAGAAKDPLTRRAGKRVGCQVYVDPEAISAKCSNLRQAELELYWRALQLLKKRLTNGRTKHFPHQVVHIGPSSVRFLQLSSLCEPHPHAINALKIYVDTGTWVRFKGRRQIFHRMDTIIHPLNPVYPFHRAVTQLEEEQELIGPNASMKSFGSMHKWNGWIHNRVGLIRYEQSIKQLRREYLERMRPEEIEQLNSTANLGGKAVVLDHVERTATCGQTVLNFGCGIFDRKGEIPHSARLRQHGFLVTNHDIGDHSRHGVPDALERKYDIVMASNVLNVQPNWATLAKTLAEIAAATKPDGKAILNYPRRPRFCPTITEEQMRLTIGVYFGQVGRASKSDSYVFEASGPK